MFELPPIVSVGKNVVTVCALCVAMAIHRDRPARRASFQRRLLAR